MYGRKIRWVPFSKGGGFSPFYYDVHLVVDWDDKRNTFNGFLWQTWTRNTSIGSIELFLSARAYLAEKAAYVR